MARENRRPKTLSLAKYLSSQYGKIYLSPHWYVRFKDDPIGAEDAFADWHFRGYLVAAVVAVGRAEKYKTGGIVTADELAELFKKQDGKCAACGIALLRIGIGKRNKFHWDHKIPVTRGGQSIKENMQALCHSCNSRKSIRTPEEWAAGVSVSRGSKI